MSSVGIIGCGVIAPAYAGFLREVEWLELAACADGVPERASEFTSTYGGTAMTVDEVLADGDIDVVVNLTPPLAHHAVSLAALGAGRAVYSEKPLGVTFADGTELVDAARAAGLRLGCAPDTFLGMGLQTARAAIDRGDIGEPLAANAFMLGAGPEWWHPAPEAFYAAGAGPLLDMGPYYLTALVQLLGPIRMVSGAARIPRAVREIRTDPRRGEPFAVTVPTHVSSTLEFSSGPIATFVASFDVWSTRYRNIEIYGSEGTLSVPDPNHFEGTVMIQRTGEFEWSELDPVVANVPQQRGLGLADMVWAANTGCTHRASDALALHVLEAMSATLASADDGRRIELTTTCDRAAPLATGLPPNTFDD